MDILHLTPPRGMTPQPDEPPELTVCLPVTSSVRVTPGKPMPADEQAFVLTGHRNLVSRTSRSVTPIGASRLVIVSGRLR